MTPIDQSKKFASVYWVAGTALIVPKLTKGMRLYDKAVTSADILPPDADDMARKTMLLAALGRGTTIAPNAPEPPFGAGQDWPDYAILFADHLGLTCRALDKALALVSVLQNGDALTFTYCKRARGKLAFTGLPPKMQQHCTLDAPPQQIAALMKPLSA